MKESYDFLSKLFQELPNREKITAFCLLVLMIVVLSIEAHSILKIGSVLFFICFVLWRSTAAALRNDRLLNSAFTQKKTFGAFISAPMASANDEKHRDTVNCAVKELKSCLLSSGEKKQVYYAGIDRPTEDKYDLPSFALEHNWEVLSQSEKHIAIIETEKSSSTFLEVGAALSLGLPSVWFIKRGVSLPFLMSDPANLSNAGSLPKVSVYEYDDLNDVINKIKQHGSDIFL